MQHNYCGHPDYEVTCLENQNQNQPALLISEAYYLIRDISYANHSLTVVNTEEESNSCSVPLQNFTIKNTPFEFDHIPVNLFFFYNCTRSVLLGDQSFQLNCSSSVTGNRSYVLFEHDLELPYLNYTLQTCKSTVSAPVYTNGLSLGDLQGMNYSTLMNRGFLLEWTENVNCSRCEVSGGRCGYYEKQFLCLCPNGPNGQTCTGGIPLGTKLAIVIVPIIIFVIILLAILMRRKLLSNGMMSFWKKKTRNTQNVEAFLRNLGSPAPKRYSYSDIKKMTNSFKEKLGQGGYGGVFKGNLPDGRLVAVKVLNASKGNGEEFINEVSSISRTSHVNIVTLLGFCFDGSKRALIYEFMTNGSLEKFIYNKKSMKTYPHLGWERLYQIAIGIAQGLEYLHRGCNTRILHFDIKPHNVLLDEDFCPKISDFGLAKLCPRKDSIISMADARGTVGYIAPEVFSRNFGGVSHKSDVYSYGMMVLEMVGGRRNIDAGVDHTSEIYFPHWIYKHIGQGEHLQLDMVMREEDEEIAKKMVLVGLWCIQMDPTNRPSISKVVDMLEGSLESLPIPPKPVFSSPPRQVADSFTGSSS
ncbi:LEAF RUST 10 DISEASE-RESISTANCE LOCUS RECEPTOR-LIKE PROTEIN KINASE-like 2.1 [Macadamia integrifolia]|uniref:LEAF RUST 10 DISEASE-RESISTANCE LOCUS RECEPTOR-LIKE PROTEIN KINASE-like 2.1 n=1 Tax=Macadamia integrifolia TaxID=60698 RepID=UPI001C4F17B8|nr:LEAF RUST 10 DISEASE-RESISTANCE LOCUS RECEPTOR-LIKE PROTEIN KINASE-like 2.1 [Macadamia integrifolia]